MTAPDSRDSVERVVAEMREMADWPHATADRMELFRWADRLQALARGPQQAGGEDHSPEEIASVVSDLHTLAKEGWIVADIAANLIEKLHPLQAEVARLLGQNERLASAVRDTITRAETAEAALREAGRPVGYVYSEIVDTEGTQPVRIKRAVLQGEYAQTLPNGTPLYAALNGGQDDNA